ncbi:autotransporter outer membrane beta-barrel domain-containing protein [Bradyrhizobium sp.]|uniref:autotransporter outer membrane beta-barrel domain-containing protein n=1 Tax=Bradyrhizobium sp. TaxID=376 RepID=UPI002DDD42D3|nr:autotransporter domain-containing protein [Bradyrhizobium sp.]HEV2158179.1 autotransporter domain-containing protein [Bradyrhizobium sp.]
MQQQFRPSWAALGRTIPLGAPFAVVLTIGVAGHSGNAFAACSVSAGPNSVTCDDTWTSLTTNLNAASTSSNDYHQLFTFGSAVTGTINAGKTVTNQGLWVESTFPAASVTFTNNGWSIGAGNALRLGANGGDIVYSGNGSLSAGSASTALLLETSGAGSITVGTSGTPVAPNYLGGSGLVAQADVGAIAVSLNAGNIAVTGTTGTGLYMASSGAISATLTGNTSIQNSTASANSTVGINAGSIGGTINVTSDANIGSAGTAFLIGIRATETGGGNVTVSQTGGAIFAANTGVFAVSAGAGAISITTGVGSSITMTGGSAIAATSTTGTGAIDITAAGAVSGGLYGINATIANIANTRDITIAANGSVNASLSGINALTIGTGKIAISVGAGATVQGGTYGVDLASGSSANIVTNNGTITGGTGVRANATTTVTNAGSIEGTGGTAVLLNGANSLFVMSGPAATLTGLAVGSGSDTFRFAGTGSNSFDVSQIAAGWTLLDKTGSSIWTLTGTSTYAGPVTVNGGTLAVNGNLSAASGVTVDAGGTLGGNGTVGSTIVNGGTLAPGNSIGLLTVSGSLTFTAASTYMVEVSPASADRVNVTGTATLGGATVNAVFAPGAYVARQYTILNAGSISGTFGLVNTSLPSGFKSSLSYDASNVYLDLALSYTLPVGSSVNQQNVANAVTNFFNSTGGIPAVFGALTPAGLTQISGETATGAQQATFDAMNMFMGVLTDPFVAGRDDPRSTGGTAGYAAEDSDALAFAAGRKRTGAKRDAYAAMSRKAPQAQPFGSRWSVWAVGFGGSQTTDGNAVLGSNAVTSRIAGGTAGADYWFSPDTVAGFALAGGGTSFSVANGGTGRSDLFQAGAFVRHNQGAAYVTGALAYGWQDVTTDRNVAIAGVDHLQARFKANAYSGRLEGGYRFVTPMIGGVGLTPYAAVQFTTFDLPAYAERAVTGNTTFALSYASKSVTDTRSELGLRSDKSFGMADGIATLRGRLAWAHDFNPDRSIGATFQALPGASFVVNGAAQATDAALVTASAEKSWFNGWAIAATFEGEFSNVTRSYAGKGAVKYQW